MAVDPPVYVPLKHVQIARLRYALHYERNRCTAAGDTPGANECLGIDRLLTKYVLAATKMNFGEKDG